MEIQGQVTEMGLVEHYVSPAGNIRVRDSLLLTPSWGAIYYESLDFGFPAIRESSEDYPTTDGAFDNTRLHGGRAVSLALRVLDNAFGDAPIPGTDYLPRPQWNSASELVSLLGGWMAPNRRPYLYYRLSGQVGHKRWIDLRSSGAVPGILDRESRTSRVVQLNWISPSGKLRSFNEGPTGTPDGRTRALINQESVGLTGRALPWTMPLTFAVTTLPNTVIPYLGTVQTGFVLRLQAQGGPIVNPRVEVTAPDGSISVMGLDATAPTIAAGEIIEFNTQAKTVTKGINVSDPAQRYNSWLTYDSTWPQLQPGYVLSDTGANPGTNRVRITVSSGTVTAEALWHDAHLL